MSPISIPNLPTDNLYKFYSLSGIVLIIFTYIVTIIFVINIYNDLSQLKLSIKRLEIELHFAELGISEYNKRNDELNLEMTEYDSIMDRSVLQPISINENIELMQTNPEWRNYLEFVYTYGEHIIPEVKQLKELEELRLKINNATKDIKLKYAEIEVKNDQILRKNQRSKIVMWIMATISIIGFLLAYFGFKFWKIKVQNPIDRKLQLEIRILELKEKELLEKQEKICKDN